MNLINLHQSCKQALRRTGFGDTALHIHLGLAIWFALVLTVGKGSLSSPWPLVLMLGIELTNEILDRMRKGKWFLRETLIDVVHTAFWPVMVWMIVHYGVIIK